MPFLVEMNSRSGKVNIDLLSNEGVWRDLLETREDVSRLDGNFIFPLNIPPTGLELSIRAIKFTTNIYNHGNIETAIRMTLKATGTVTNPFIENPDTGDFIKVKRTLLKGDTLEINTEFGSKRVEIIRENGDRDNVFNYIDYQSKFFPIGSW